MEPIKVGIVGFGRSGCGIHASAIKDMRDMFDVVAIADFIPERRSHEAFPNAKPYASAEALIADPNVEMVIVSTFNSMHAPVARMKGGKHVLCEKPFGFTTADVDSMIAEAKAAGKVLQPFQQRRFEEDFQKVRSIIRSGILGKISYIQICWDGFGRRWDWQTSRQYGGGQLYNNMPHLVDHAMELFGDGEPEVQCMVASSLSIGPAEDEVHLTLTGKDCGMEERAPMCGVPFHAADGYISRLVKKGYKVAVAEQMEDPRLAKGLVKREVIKVVTPGTITAAGALEEGRNNYLVCVVYAAGSFGILLQSTYFHSSFFVPPCKPPFVPQTHQRSRA